MNLSTYYLLPKYLLIPILHSIWKAGILSRYIMCSNFRTTKLCRVSRRHKPYELCRAQTARAAVAKGEEDRRTCRPIDAVVGPLGLSPSGHGSSRGETSVRALLCPRLALLAFFYSLLLFGGSKAEEYVERKEHVISRCQPLAAAILLPIQNGLFITTANIMAT